MFFFFVLTFWHRGRRSRWRPWRRGERSGWCRRPGRTSGCCTWEKSWCVLALQGICPPSCWPEGVKTEGKTMWMIQTHQPGSGFFPNCPSKSWLMAEDVTVTTCQKSFLKVYFNSFCSSSLGNKSWMCTLIFLYQCDDHFPGRSLYMHIRDAKVFSILPFNTSCLVQYLTSNNGITKLYQNSAQLCK